MVPNPSHSDVIFPAETDSLDKRRALCGIERSWFVYLFPLTDCSAFKVGFTCNPLQRIYSFSHRYFEHFDLYESVLLEVIDCADARETEAALKSELADFRIGAPTWVPLSSGGHTEWFQAVEFRHAEERLRSFADTIDAARLVSTSDYIRVELAQARAAFEVWAWSQAQRVSNPKSFGGSAADFVEAVSSLRDWLHAYRYFDIPLFADDAAVREFVANSAREGGYS